MNAHAIKIKILLFLSAFILILVLLFYNYTNIQHTVSTSNHIKKDNVRALPLPDIEIASINNKKISLRKIEGDVILLNFWASWCKSCITELPSIIQLVKKYNGKVSILAISIDSKKENIINFLKKLERVTKHKADIPNIYWLWDKDKEISLKLFNTLKVPETIIINKDRMMVKKIVGLVDWMSQDITKFIDNLLLD